MPESENDKPRTLEYRSKGDEDRTDWMTLIGAALLASCGFGLVLFGSVVYAAIASYSKSQPLFVLIPIAVAVAGLVGALLVLRRRRTLGAGLLIGVGLALLIHGVCFAVMNG